MSNIEIICGDSISEIQKIPDESVDLIIADPPYNLGKEYGNSSGRQNFDEYLNFTKHWITGSCSKIIALADGTRKTRR